MSTKSAYYDSDDDVAWGPLTLREIKRTFRDPCKRKVNRRHTIESKLISEKLRQPADQTEVEKVTKMDNLHKGTFQSKQSDNKMNTTGSSNEYYTPNVTFNHGKNIFLPNADSFYVSCEETKEKNRFEDTHMQFLDLANNRKTSLYLDNVQQTLVEESVLNNISSENNRSLEETEVHDSCYMKSFNSSNSSQQYEEDNIIILSSDDESNSFLTANKSKNNSFNNVSVKMEQIELSDSVDSERSSTENVDRENESFQTSNEDEFEYDIDSSSQKSSEDDIQKFSNSSESSSSSETKPSNPHSYNSDLNKNLTVGGESPLPCMDFSPVQVPKIDLAAFDETEDCLELNNTLEEIERMLNASNSSTSSSSEGSSSSDQNSSNLLKPSNSPTAAVHIISGSFSQSPSAKTYRIEDITPGKTNNPSRDPTPSKTPNLKPGMSKIIRGPTPSKTPIEKPGSSSAGKPVRKDQFVSKIAVPTPTNNFRVPKTPTPVKPKPALLNSKKIVSPVGVYIKYSPKSPLMTHVKNTFPKKVLPALHEEGSQKTGKAVNETGNASGQSGLPPVVYRPARQNLYSVKENLFLPPSIEKLVKKSTLVKHEGRLHLATKNKEEQEQKLEEETDLTSCTIRSSLLDESDRNVSVLASRQAFGK